MDIYTVAFFGHRYIDNPFRIEDRLEEEIRRLLSEHEDVDFLVGVTASSISLHPPPCFESESNIGMTTAPSFLCCRMREPSI